MRKIPAILLVVTCCIVSWRLTPGQGMPGSQPIPEKLRAELEEVLQTEVAQLAAQKNADGNSFKRGTFSRDLEKLDESTFQTTMHQDTASADTLKTERFRVTLKKSAAGKWEIADRHLDDTVEALRRSVVGDEEFYHFDKLQLVREGMKVSGTNGFTVKDFRAGEPSAYLIWAPDLAWEYAPPKELSFSKLLPIFKKKYPNEFAFKPEYATLECVPESCRELEPLVFTGLRKLSGATELDAQPKKFYDAQAKAVKDDQRQNGFRGFRIPTEADRRNYTLSLKRDGGEEFWVFLDVDNREQREVSFGTTNRGVVFAYNTDAVRKSGASPYELEQRDDLTSLDYEVDSLKGTVELALVDPGTLQADLTYDLILKRDLRQLQFAIASAGQRGRDDSKPSKLAIDSFHDTKGNELTWIRLGASSGLVVFPEVQRAGSKVSLRLQFRGEDSIEKVNPSFSYLNREGWLPFLQFKDAIRVYELTTRVPEKYTVLGAGRKVSEVRKDGVLETKWASSTPVSFPTVIFGDYITDKPKIKATKKDGTEIAVNVYVDKVSTQSARSQGDAEGGAAGIRGSQLQAMGDQAVNALNIFREMYGYDYPFTKLDLVNSPTDVESAQAPASMIYLASSLFRGEGIRGTSGGASSAKFGKDTVSHETAHQWWGHRVHHKNWANYWFVESLAEMSSALWVEAVYGRKKYLEKVADWRAAVLEWDPLVSVQDSPVLWQGENAFRGYLSSVYAKGPFAFHILRETFGPEKFDAFLKALFSQTDGKEIVTRDIQKAAEESFQGNMDWFFDQWIRGVGIPQYSFNYEMRATEDKNWLVSVRIKQRVLFGRDNDVLEGVYFRGVVPVTVLGSKGKEYPAKILVQGAETTFQFKVPEEPRDIVFNKYNEILAHDVVVNRSW